MTSNGIHSMSFEQYQGAAGVSNSMLRILSTRTPLHLRTWMTGAKPEATAAMRFGTLVHRCIFEPETVENAFWIKPDGMKFTTKDGKQWQDEHANRPIISADDSFSIMQMIASVHGHPVAGRLLKNARFEASLFAQDSHGTLLKARADILPNGGNILPDLKSCDSAAPDDFTKAIGNYGYYRQAAYYLDICKLLGMGFDAFVLIAVEKTPPFAVACYQIEPMAVRLGQAQYQRDLAIYRECEASGKWPGYPERISALSVPQWMQKELEAA